MKTSTLRQIEDRLHRELGKLKVAAESDATLQPMVDELLSAWGLLFCECQRRDEVDAAKDGGGEVLCTVFSPRNGAVQSTEICRRMIRRRYRQEPGATEFVDVLPVEIRDSDQLGRHMRMTVV